MQFLSTVKFDGLKPPVWFALGMIDLIYKIHAGKPVIGTSGQDGVHKDARNIHGNGLAIDVRSHNLSGEQKNLIYSDLVKYLEPLGYDVVLEDLNGPNEHYHAEFDPKGTENFYKIIPA